VVTDSGFDAGSVLGQQSCIISSKAVCNGPATNYLGLPVMAMVPQVLEDVNGTRASTGILQAPGTIFEAKVDQAPDDMQHATS